MSRDRVRVVVSWTLAVLAAVALVAGGFLRYADHTTLRSDPFADRVEQALRRSASPPKRPVAPGARSGAELQLDGRSCVRIALTRAKQACEKNQGRATHEASSPRNRAKCKRPAQALIWFRTWDASGQVSPRSWAEAFARARRVSLAPGRRRGSCRRHTASTTHTSA